MKDSNERNYALALTATACGVLCDTRWLRAFVRSVQGLRASVSVRVFYPLGP